MSKAVVLCLAGWAIGLIGGLAHFEGAALAGVGIFLVGWSALFFGQLLLGFLWMYRAAQNGRTAALERKARFRRAGPETPRYCDEPQRNSGITFSANRRNDVSSG